MVFRCRHNIKWNDGVFYVGKAKNVTPYLLARERREAIFLYRWSDGDVKAYYSLVFVILNLGKGR